MIPHNSVGQTSSPPWPGTFTGVGTRQQHHQHNIALDKFWTTVLDLWLSSGSVKKPCISMSPINHLYYGSAEYQKTHQIASYMWPGNMPGGDVISAVRGEMWWGRNGVGSLWWAVLASNLEWELLADHQSWPLIGHTSRDWPLIGQEHPSHEGGETVTLTVARISRVMRNTEWGLITCYAIHQNYNTTTHVRACRKIILKKPQEQQVCLFQVKKHLTFWLEDQATLSVFIANQCMIGGHFCWFYDRR